MKYHRFVLRQAKAHPTNDGAVSEGSRLWASNKLDPESDEELGKIIKWFNHYLLVPKKIPKGLFWFKDNTRFIAKGIELQKVMQNCGIAVVHITTEDPGEILFEDKYQVTARFNRRVKYVVS